MDMHHKDTMSSLSNIIVIIHRPEYDGTMKRLQAFKFELMPTGAQEQQMRCFSGSCRFVYNKALAIQKENHEAGKKFIGYVSLAAHLTSWKRECDTEWLRNAPSQALQHALKDLEKAYKNFFAKRSGYPRFKRKGSGGSFRYPEPKQIKIFCIKSLQRLAKTTHSFVLSICRLGICPSHLKGMVISQVEW